MQLKPLETLPVIYRVKSLPSFQEYEYVLQNHTATTKLYPEAV